MPMFSKATYERQQTKVLIAKECADVMTKVYRLENRVRELEEEVKRLKTEKRIVRNRQYGAFKPK